MVLNQEEKEKRKTARRIKNWTFLLGP